MMEELDLERDLCQWQGYYFYAHTAILENEKRSNHQMHTDKTNRDHSLDSPSVAEAQSVSRLCDRSAADAVLSRLSWKWRKRSSVKIAERTYEKRAQALHC